MEKEKGQANDIIRELSERAKENLRRNEELRRNASPFLSIQPSEKLAELFDAEKVEPVEKEFEGKKVQRFQYTVTDPNTGQQMNKTSCWY